MIFLQPRTLKEALTMLPATPIAGCTDVMVGLHFGTLQPHRFLNLWRLKELRGIRAKSALRLGALTTYTELIESPVVRERLPMLVEAARQVGGVQIQNRGTIGGNIANASPAGDTLPVFAAADATVVLVSKGGERRVRFREFYTGYRKTVMRPDELILAVEVPDVPGRQWFRKVGTRAAQAISKVVIAGVRAETSCVALGSVAPTVVWFEGSTLEGLRQAMKIAPIDDVRSTAEYRLTVSRNLLARFWRETDAAEVRVDRRRRGNRGNAPGRR